ncbi:MAG: PrsW family glutamic-type intramembrane protease [Patescibacteria group bacterium]
MIAPELFIYAAAGGLLPAILWLWFWLREDRTYPEPRRILALTFLGGMIAILPAIALQLSVDTTFASWFQNIESKFKWLTYFGGASFFIFIHAAIEELMKFGLCFITALRTKQNDEPVDSIIYLITTALGFAAVENTLFILSSYMDSPTGNQIVSSLIVGNIRFVGASVLHVAASAFIGIALAMAFKKSLPMKILFGSLGIIFATILHTFFNFLIIDKDSGFLFSFPLAWIAVVFLILSIEKIKKIKI